MAEELKHTKDDSGATGGRHQRSCSPPFGRRLGMNSTIALAAIAMASLGGGGYGGGSFGNIWDDQPPRPRRYPRGPCEKCGKKNVAAGRLRGVCLCADCGAENNSDQTQFCCDRQDRYGAQICSFTTDQRLHRCCFLPLFDAIATFLSI